MVGTTLNCGIPGYGVHGGDLQQEENLGYQSARVADENLLQRHAKRGLVTMLNDGPNSNGSEFCITFDEAHYLDGYHNIVGEVVQGLPLLD